MTVAWYARGAGPEVAWESRTLGLVSVADTIRPYVVEGEVTAVDLEVIETITPRATDVANSGLSRVVADTITGRVAEGIAALEKAGTFARSASDTITPVLAEAATYDATVSVTDTLTPVVTDATTFFDGTKGADDTITLVLDETALVNAIAGRRDIGVADTVAPWLVDALTRSGGGDVDHIRINERRYGRIRINAA